MNVQLFCRFIQTACVMFGLSLLLDLFGWIMFNGEVQNTIIRIILSILMGLYFTYDDYKNQKQKTDA